MPIVEFRGYSLAPFTNPNHVANLEVVLSKLPPDVFSSGLLLDDETVPQNKPVLPEHFRGFIRETIDREKSRFQTKFAQWKNFIPDWPDIDTRSRVLGSVHFISGDGKENLHVHFDDWTFSPCLEEKRFGNSVTIEKEFDQIDESTDETIRRVCKKFFDNSLFDYGYCCDAEEYWAKNIDQSDGGARAVGLDVSKYLPGFYWGNYFSDRLQGRMPRVKEDLEGYESVRLSVGILLLGKYPAWDWDKPENVARNRKAVEIIGEQFFFNTNATHRENLFSVTDEPPQAK